MTTIIATFEDLYVASRLWGLSKEETMELIQKMQKTFTLEELKKNLPKGKVFSPSGKELGLEELYQRIIHGKVIDPITGEKIEF